MVVCAKKNGKPRRTVDFQQLNIHAITIPPGAVGPSWQEENCTPRIEWLT
jgi:hypothetical protein